MKTKKILVALSTILTLNLSAQTFETGTADYVNISTYDSWSESPFRTGTLTPNASLVDNPYKDALNPTGKCAAYQRSRYASNLYGVRVDLYQPFELTKEPKYIHALVHRPKSGKVMCIGLGKKRGVVHQEGRDIEQFRQVSINEVGTGEWCDAVFMINGAGDIDISSLVFVTDAESPHDLTQDHLAYIDEILVNDSPDPRVAATMAEETPAKEDNKFSFKFYGNIRGDLFYNSRASNELVDGLFYLYPKDHNYDADGNDLSATPEGSFYIFITRLGVDMKGPKVGKAATTAKIEIDFRGAGSSWMLPRIRHAYVNLDWGKSSFLFGQTWHPLFGDVFPSMLNISTGAPFQPFNRSPQLRYRYQAPCGLQLTASAIWQMQYTSVGPEGKIHNYLKNSCIPEFFGGVDYKKGEWIAGAGVEMLSMVPRQTSNIEGNVYKVHERITSLSAEAHLRYKTEDWQIGAKTVLANNLTQMTMLSGYGVTDKDPRTGEMKYTPFRHSTTWLNVVYGKKWQPGMFLGYLKNLGTGKSITGETYGTGLDIDQMFSTNWQLTYNLPHWRLGAEFSTSTAWFGTLNNSNGRIIDTHAVTNYRIYGVVMFIF